MGDWQSIETAPKDGRVVDLWCMGEMGHDGKHRYRRSPECYWNGQWVSPMHGDWEYGNGRLRGLNPTHWMPLPEAPQ